MEEKKIILIPISDVPKKTKKLAWSEAMEYLNLTSLELRDVILTGESCKGYFVDESL